MKRKRARRLGPTLSTLGLCCALLASTLPACNVLAARKQSTVAQGRYYASGDERYDEFFVGLFLLQVQMERAPEVPELERWNLAHALGATPDTTGEEVGRRLREQAQKLKESGLALRLDRVSEGDPALAKATLSRSDAEKAGASASAPLLNQVERSATALVRSVADMEEADRALDGLAGRARELTSSVDADFVSAPVGKAREVKSNLADAGRLVVLMKARAAEVHEQSERMLAAVTRAVDTDDGSRGPLAAKSVVAEAGAETRASGDAHAVGSSSARAEGAARGDAAAKRAVTHSPSKPKARNMTPNPPSSGSPIALPRPARTSSDAEADGEAPTKPAKAEKAATATPPRDFEP